jgi:hypothetical protein
MLRNLTILVSKSYTFQSDLEYGVYDLTGECLSTSSTAREPKQLQSEEERILQAAT